MRKSLWIIPLAFAAIGVPNARADTLLDYSITFTTNAVNIAAPVGSFEYDNTTNQFTNFTVSWDGLIFDFTSAANNPSIISGGPGCSVAPTGPQTTYALMATCTPSNFPVVWEATAQVGGGNPASSMSIAAGTPYVDYVTIGSQSSGFPTIPAVAASGNVSAVSFTGTTITPEPGTGSLMLMGIGFVLVMVIRNRIVRGRQTAPGTHASLQPADY